MNHIIPTIFAKNKKQFQDRFQKLLPISKNLQIDIMDGKFVRAKSISISQILKLPKTHNFEAHLMTEYPQKRIPKIKRLGFKKFIFHYSAVKKPEQVIQRAKNHKLAVWIAINPKTPVEKIIPLLPMLDGVLFMGVVPGHENQSFIPSVLKKIKTLRKISPKTKTQVDGGATPKIVKKLAKLGVTYVNSGSYISSSENPKQAYKKLSALYRKYKK